MTRKTGSWALLGLLAVLLGLGPVLMGGQDRIEKPRIFQDTYPIVTETDYYCSFFAAAEPLTARIEAADSTDGKLLLSDGDDVWARGPAGAAVKPGQVYAIVQMPVPPVPGKKVAGPGPIAFRRGRLRVVRVEGQRFLARLEKSCGVVRVGDYLAPFEEKAPFIGKDLGYQALFQGGEVMTGRLVYFRDELNQIGPGDWALLDIGSQQGLRVGQQLTAFSKPQGERPARAAANLVVIDAAPVTATVKVLSARDSLRLGDLVQVK
jgi:hypothetical protein